MGPDSFVVNPERNVLPLIPAILETFPTTRNISVILFRDRSTFPSDQLVLVRQDINGKKTIRQILRYVTRDRFFSDSHITKSGRVVVLDPTTIRGILEVSEDASSLMDGPFMVTRPKRMDCNVGEKASDVQSIALASLRFWNSPPIFRENTTALSRIEPYKLPKAILAEALEDRDY